MKPAPMDAALPSISPIDTYATANLNHKEELLASCSCVNRSAGGEFRYFISFVVSITILGASTLAVVAGEMADPVVLYGEGVLFRLQTVRTFFASAWLCFILALAIAGYTSSAMTLVERAKGSFSATRDQATWKWELRGIVVAAALHLLIISGFLGLSLGMAAYVGVVGWVAVGFCAAAAVFVVSLVTYQVMSHLRIRPHSQLA